MSRSGRVGQIGKYFINEQQVNHEENYLPHNVNKLPYPNIQTLGFV